jgi:hypothetical protein
LFTSGINTTDCASAGITPQRKTAIKNNLIRSGWLKMRFLMDRHKQRVTKGTICSEAYSNPVYDFPRTAYA